MLMTKFSILMLLMTVCLPLQSCYFDNLFLHTPMPDRVLEANDEYEVIWSLPDIYMDNCSQDSLMANTEGRIFVEGRLSKLLRPSLSAIDSLKGDIVWQIKPASGPNKGIILVQNEVLYRATVGMAAVEAYSTTDGTLLWQAELTGGHSASNLNFAENKIFVLTNDLEFFILNTQGEIIGHRYPVSNAYLEKNGVFYKADTALRAIEISTERELWQVHVSRLGNLPIFDDETIFMRTIDSDGYIYSIDQDTGKVNWKVSQNIKSNLFLANKKIYFLSSDGYLVSIDRDTGLELSKVKFTVQFDLNNLKTTGDYCINGDPENDVLAVAFRDNSQLLGLKIKKP